MFLLNIKPLRFNFYFYLFFFKKYFFFNFFEKPFTNSGAGGIRFIHSSLFFKFSIDVENIYGSTVKKISNFLDFFCDYIFLGIGNESKWT
jgi:hypothetical protein